MILDQVAGAPNPQFVREISTDLCGQWEFAHDDEQRGIAEQWYASGSACDRTIEVPYPPESKLSGIGDTGFHPTCWYRRTFRDMRTSADERLLLRFGAVDYEATVWVNGRYVGRHEGGSMPFALDVTDALHAVDDDQVVTVRAYDDPHDLEQPRGKQDWLREPHTIFYHRTSGIWQPVWLEVAPAIRIEDIHWTFDPAAWTVGAEITLNRPAGDGSRLDIQLETPEGEPVSGRWTVRGRTLKATLDPHAVVGEGGLRSLLWSPDRPNLIGTRVTLISDAGEDTVLGYTGLRTVSCTENAILINDEPVFLRLVLSQGYWPESHLAAPSRDAIIREVDAILALGFNGARLHQKAEDPRFLFEADRKGLILWGEIGNAFAYSELAIARHAAEWREVVTRDRNHPSIIAWVPFNESWGIDNVALRPDQRHAVRAVYHQTHALDDSRPVIGNDGWENVIGDIVTAHDYNWDADELDRLYGGSANREVLVSDYRAGHRRLLTEGMEIAGKPIILSEFGGVSFAPASGEEWYGYGTVSSPEEFVERLQRLVNAVSPPAMIAGFCYTQLTDTLQETNGLLDERRNPKADASALRAIMSVTGGG